MTTGSQTKIALSQNRLERELVAGKMMALGSRLHAALASVSDDHKSVGTEAGAMST
jgi:hypothetical protein